MLDWGVPLNKGFKRAFALLFSLLIFITANIAEVYAAQANTVFKAAGQNAGKSIECLYPVHLRRDLFYDKKLTEENLPYLKNISPTEALSTLNVLRGNNGNLMPERYAERVESAAILVRLLGVEEYVLSKEWAHPFTDVPDWADPYIGYLYQSGLTNGITDNLYGSHHIIDEKSYLTFLLRALGYSDKNGKDFTWDTVGSAAVTAGLISSGEAKSIGNLINRERLSQLSWRAMFLNHKIKGKPLLICLYEQGMIKSENLAALFEKNKSRLIDKWFELIPKLETAFIRHDSKIELSLNKEQVMNDLHKHVSYVVERVQLTTGAFLQGYSTELWQYGSSYTLYLYPNYENTAAGDERLRLLVDKIIASIISPSMTDYDKVKAVHDYLVTRLKYDSRDSSMIAASSYKALGALETGIAVCKAYSELMALILNRAGVPCRIVVGVANGTDHAWNIVSIDGELYHVDVTWDDPVTNGKDGSNIRYDYFNLSDEEMKKDHYWDRNNYPACTSTSQNYFVKNNLVIESSEALKAAIKKLIEKRQSRMTVKYPNFNKDDIHNIINDVNVNASYAISGYSYSFNESTGVFCLEIEYKK